MEIQYLSFIQCLSDFTGLQQAAILRYIYQIKKVIPPGYLSENGMGGKKEEVILYPIRKENRNMCVIDKIKNIPSVTFVGLTMESDILDAEIKLGLEFPQEYLNYLRTFGSIELCGHELTGLGVEGKLNVVTATDMERSINKYMPKDMFVLENIDIKGVVIVMDTDGSVYLLQHEALRKVSNSLSEYLEFLI